MVKIRFFERSVAIIATTLGVAMMATSFAGLGLKVDASDAEKAGKAKDALTPELNLPLGSVLDLLGVENREEMESDPEPATIPTPTITPPSTVTDNPFGDPINSDDSRDNSNSPTSNTSPPYGSVPLIANDAASVDYLLQKLLGDAKANAQAQELTPAVRKIYENYARKLAKTLSKLTQEQQNFVFHGVKN